MSSGEPSGARRVCGDVGFDGAVEELALMLVGLLEGVRILIGHDAASAQGAGLVQRARAVDFAPVIVPAAGAGGHRELRHRRGALAHQVDGGRRVAGPFQQARGAAHDLDPVIDLGGGLVDGVERIRVGDVDRHAVDLQVVDLLATRLVGRALRTALNHRNAGGRLQHVVQVPHGLIIHALARHHRYRLRRLALRQVQARGAVRHLHDVGVTGVHGRQIAGHRDRCERGGLGRRTPQGQRAVRGLRGFKSAARQRGAQRSIRGVYAPHGGGIQAAHELRIVGNDGPAQPCNLGQRGVQAARGQIERDGRPRLGLDGLAKAGRRQDHGDTQDMGNRQNAHEALRYVAHSDIWVCAARSEK
ncbi:hypothetical protein G6F57_015953 [Rhizopus arrhizus]|nr:hypothetical protein G6F57_015953 [Rhizopus arrhizus]